MGNLKIRVNNEAESKEAQELFQKLAGKENGFITMDKSIRWVALYQGQVAQYEFLPSVELNEITLPELRDMVNDQYAEIEQVRQATKDNVSNPSHYTQGKVECIDALESATIGKSGIEAVCVANVIKYLWRYEEKNGLEDVKKAQWYLERLVASMGS